MTKDVFPESDQASLPLASVVVTNYNYARFIGETIDSALAQTYANLEVLVVDDGSTDESRAVIESFGARVTPVFKENGGMASAINAGFRASRGDVVVFLDSDDLLLPRAVAESVELLRDKRVAKVHWTLREMDAEGKDTGRVIPIKQLPSGDLVDLVIEKGPMVGNGPPTSGNAWSRRYLEQVFPMPEKELRQHADAYMNTLACLYGELRTLSEPHGRYRVHGGNDYASQPMSDRLKRNLQMYYYRCRLLSARLRASGIEVQPAVWKTPTIPSYYGHLQRSLSLVQEISALIPPGGKFILVDDNAFPAPLLADRESVRFPTSPDNPQGLPADDEAAIEALEVMRVEGAGFVVFAQRDVWWLKRYPGMRRHLESRYICELATDFVVAFNLCA